MAEPNFSNLRMGPAMLVAGILRGHRIADEDWLEVVERCRPPFLRQPDLLVLRKQLDPDAERRGSRTTGPRSTSSLLKTLKEVRRSDVPPAFIDHLIERLVSKRRYTKVDSNRDYIRRWRTRDRDMIIQGVYDQIYDLLDGNPRSVTHEILGSTEVPRDVRRTKSETAIQITHDLLGKNTILIPPAVSTIMKIVSETPLRKRRPRS